MEEVLSPIFEGMKFDIVEQPSTLPALFKSLPKIEIQIVGLVYLIKYRGIIIASIESGSLYLTPGFAIHRHKAVFKTYNKLLRHFTKNRFLKSQYPTTDRREWVLCTER